MHVIVWEFVVRVEKLDEFVEAYAADGAWARLFRLGKGYLGTELIADRDREDRFLTIDRWTTVEDFGRFKEEFEAQYKVLEEWFEGLILSERRLGGFALVG